MFLSVQQTRVIGVFLAVQSAQSFQLSDNATICSRKSLAWEHIPQHFCDTQIVSFSCTVLLTQPGDAYVTLALELVAQKADMKHFSATMYAPLAQTVAAGLAEAFSRIRQPGNSLKVCNS